MSETKGSANYGPEANSGPPPVSVQTKIVLILLNGWGKKSEAYRAAQGHDMKFKLQDPQSCITGTRPWLADC